MPSLPLNFKYHKMLNIYAIPSMNFKYHKMLNVCHPSYEFQISYNAKYMPSLPWISPNFTFPSPFTSTNRSKSSLFMPLTVRNTASTASFSAARAVRSLRTPRGAAGRRNVKDERHAPTSVGRSQAPRGAMGGCSHLRNMADIGKWTWQGRPVVFLRAVL